MSHPLITSSLAAVVIGGLFTTIVSALLVLPALYGWFDEKPEVALGM